MNQRSIYIYIYIYSNYVTNYTYICEMTQQNLGEIDCIFNNNNKQTKNTKRNPFVNHVLMHIRSIRKK